MIKYKVYKTYKIHNRTFNDFYEDYSTSQLEGESDQTDTTDSLYFLFYKNGEVVAGFALGGYYKTDTPKDKLYRRLNLWYYDYETNHEKEAINWLENYDQFVDWNRLFINKKKVSQLERAYLYWAAFTYIQKSPKRYVLGASNRPKLQKMQATYFPHILTTTNDGVLRLYYNKCKGIRKLWFSSFFSYVRGNRYNHKKIMNHQSQIKKQDK